MKTEDMLRPQDNGDYVIMFGKHDGKLLSTVCQIDYDYVDWMIFKSDLPGEVIDIVCDVVESWENGEL